MIRVLININGSTENAKCPHKKPKLLKYTLAAVTQSSQDIPKHAYQLLYDKSIMLNHFVGKEIWRLILHNQMQKYTINHFTKNSIQFEGLRRFK